MKKIYIAGRISGYKEHKEHFEKAENKLKKLGHITLNPAVLPDRTLSCVSSGQRNNLRGRQIKTSSLVRVGVDKKDEKMNKETCDKCLWKNRENCGKCRRDKDRIRWDKKQEVSCENKQERISVYRT